MDKPSQRIDARLRELADWRGRTLARVRALIRQADPGVAEEWKWGIPVWSHDGIICTGEVYKNTVKLTFAKGAGVADPAGLFNSSLEGKVRRAIDIREGEKLNEAALRKLIRAAVALNVKAQGARPKAQAKLLSGGNPQIAKRGTRRSTASREGGPLRPPRQGR